MENFEKIKAAFENLVKDMDKALNKGNKTAIRRARKAIMELKYSGHELRKDLTELVNNMPAKQKKNKTA